MRHMCLWNESNRCHYFLKIDCHLEEFSPHSSDIVCMCEGWNDRVLLSVMVLTTDSSPHTGYTFTSRVVSLPATSIKHQAPIPLKINVLTFSKSHDIKVMTLVFHPTKQISWHSASIVITLISWHWGIDIRLKVLVKMKENNHNTCIVYLLNCIDKHIQSIEVFLACLKINVKHPKNIDVETCRLRPVTSQCTKWLFPTATMCVKTVLSNETFGYIGCQGKMSVQCHRH